MCNAVIVVAPCPRDKSLPSGCAHREHPSWHRLMLSVTLVIFQGLVRFEDVAIHFSQEQWEMLAPWQQELYRAVMMENYELLVQLGQEAAKPELVSRLEWGAEPYGPEQQDLERGAVPASASTGKRSGRRAGRQRHRVGSQGDAEAQGPLSSTLKAQASLTKIDRPSPAAGSPARLGPGAHESQLQCRQCGKSFAHWQNLATHRRLHTSERSYACEACGKGFRCVHHLAAHRRTHTGERPFACPRCGQRFTQQANLRTHQAVHAGTRPFQCSQCGLRFAQHLALAQHQLLHSGECPHGCDHYGKHFATRKVLRTHVWGHHARGAPAPAPTAGTASPRGTGCATTGAGRRGSTPTAAPTAARALPPPPAWPSTGACTRPSAPSPAPTAARASERELGTHRQVHMGELRFACPRCDRRYHRQNELSKHLKLHLPEVP
ncbi:zinc finger protein 92 homolog [Alligator mississippiensis]|uniref:zinc finger protein 92 homolog n=1 Tax=Alligator mississippiensis TaxID=8496 RepID=UPI002877565D|nr:zinc finger protein 92 homolog [Alligator mississippiensis]